TVPRGRQFRDPGAYEFSGRTAGAQQAGQTGGGAAGAGGTNLTAAGGGGQLTGDVNVRGSVASGATEAVRGVVQPGATVSAQSGPDLFPFPITEQVLNEGQVRFNAFCAMCHGPTGEGDGMIVRRGFRRPPSFHEDRLQTGNASAAHFFDVVTNGWGAMPSYADMISAEHRWQIIAYVRALQLSRRGRIEDVPPAERGKLGSAGPRQQGGSER
ncbi:MAG: c-type cytochrome, partial [Pyrinomonadaceae bacterium]